MTVRVTPMPAGAAGVEYALNGAGCREQHAPEISAVDYPLQGRDHERELGIWWGEGLRHLGLEPGSEVTESDVRAVFQHQADPAKLREALAAAEAQIAAEGLQGKDAIKVREAAMESARLGNRPYRYKDLEARVAAALEKAGVDPEADPEGAARIRGEVAREKVASPRGFYDVTFSPVKSASMYYAALQAQGRTAEAERMRQIHREAVQAALAHLEDEAGYSRAGHHGKATGGRPTVGRFVRGDGLTVAMFDHMTNRNGEPQLHTHAMVWNRVRTVDADGTVRWRALDSRGLTRARAAAAAIYEREYVERMELAFPVAFEMRPDGVARELVGVTEAERMAVSSRRAQVRGKAAEWAADYERRMGRPPTRYALTLMQQAAALHTRTAKEATPKSDAELLAEWEEMVGERLQTTLADIGERIEAAGIEARAGGDVAEWDVDEVIGRALERAQAARSSWTRADLMWELQQELPSRGLGAPVAPVLEAMADRALSQNVDVVQVQGLTLLDTPDELRREDGRSMWRPRRDERYSLLSQLNAEERVVQLAQAKGGGPALSSVAVEEMIEAAAAEGRALSEDQAAVARRVLGGGRHVDVVVGPAGAGKSHAQGVIARAWTEHGGRVIGLAPSSIAAQVLQEEGIALAVNTTVFLDRAAGRGPVAEQDLLALQPNDLVILDEAGMTSTEHIAQVVGMAERAGAKVVMCGDDAQLSAVDAGGLFRTLVREVDAVELETVRRFREADGTLRQWEADASMALRRGDIHALDAYQARGRIRGGTAEDMTAAITRAAVADLLQGHDTAVLTSTTEQAAEVSAAIRDRLVELGMVEPHGAPVADGNVAGVGDVVQARQNAPRMRDSEGLSVLNRRTYRVTGRAADGSLKVRHVAGRDEHGREVLGGTVVMPPGYVREHVDLGYAGTVHSVQGRTVRRLHGLVDGSMSREGLYVLLTRGWESNRAYVVEDQEATAREVLAGVLAQETADPAALEMLRDELDWIESLPAYAPIWDDLVGEHVRERHEAALRRAMSPEDYARLIEEDASTVFRRLQEAERAGHDVEVLISEAVTPRGFDDADNLPAVLYTRIGRTVERRVPESPEAGASWRERTPATLTGPRGEVARAVADLLDARQQALGERAAAEPPEWALQQLGPVPEDPIERAAWQQRAGAVEAYRELYHVTGEGTIIGPPPGRSMVEQRAAWQRAQQALGRTPQERAMAEASEAELRAIVERMEREQQWAPPHIDDAMQMSQQAADTMAERAAVLHRRAELAADPDERARLTEQASDYELMAREMGVLSPEWEQMHADRVQWYADTAALRDQAAAARAELQAREADRRAAAEVDQAAAEHAQERDRPEAAAGREAQERAEVEQHQDHERAPEPDRLEAEMQAAAAAEAERDHGRTPTHMERWAAEYEWQTLVEQAKARGEEVSEPRPLGGPEVGQTHLEWAAQQQVPEAERGTQQPAPARAALAELQDQAAALEDAPERVEQVERTVRDQQAAERAAEQARRENARLMQEAERQAVREVERVQDGPVLEL